MAIEDFGAAKKGMKVEVLVGDHQNKPDVGANIARQWYDVDKVDVIVDVPTSSVVLAVNEITKQKGKALLVSTGATSDLTGKACNAERGPLDLRHLDAREWHGQRDRQDRRRYLVLPDRGLCVRAGARA